MIITFDKDEEDEEGEESSGKFMDLDEIRHSIYNLSIITGKKSFTIDELNWHFGGKTHSNKRTKIHDNEDASLVIQK